MQLFDALINTLLVIFTTTFDFEYTINATSSFYCMILTCLSYKALDFYLINGIFVKHHLEILKMLAPSFQNLELLISFTLSKLPHVIQWKNSKTI